jgi:hypothetical protein
MLKLKGHVCLARTPLELSYPEGKACYASSLQHCDMSYLASIIRAILNTIFGPILNFMVLTNIKAAD